MADGRFRMSRNFLATDDVPDTIFGIPVVSREEDYTERDLEFFREFPEAGGYYELGDESDGAQGADYGGDAGSLTETEETLRRNRAEDDRTFGEVVRQLTPFFRDPGSGKAEIPDSLRRDWSAYRALHPDETGYRWDSRYGFSAPGSVDGGMVRNGRQGNPVDMPSLDPSGLTWFSHVGEIPGTGRNIHGEPVTGFPKEPEGTRFDNKGGASLPFVDGLPVTDREFSRSFESAPVRIVKADGTVFYKPTVDSRGKYDIGGYRSYWSAKRNRMVDHTNDGELPEAAFTEGRRRTDEYFDSVTAKLYRKHGVDPAKLGRGAKYATWDIVFATGGNAFSGNSPKFDGIVNSLKKRGVSAEDAFTAALALEQGTYGWRNYRRFSARGGAVMDALASSQNPIMREFVDAYRGGWTGAGTDAKTPAKNELAYGTNWTKHAGGMRALSAVADRYGLVYTGSMEGK